MCVKCDSKVPEKWEGEQWTECIHNGWYCPCHSPTSNCNDEECECCNPKDEDESEPESSEKAEKEQRLLKCIERWVRDSLLDGAAARS